MQEIKQNKIYFYWLLSCCLLLILLIWVGGFTRLTGSGLSITKWEVFSGLLPPFTHEKWLEYFNLYKEIPEYKKINYGMTLDEFKVIFGWEYVHRVIARFLVLVFLIPYLYFCYKEKISSFYKKFFGFVFLLFLSQGFMGWYMVKSGLNSDIDVSHFRLAAHLSLAIIIYCLLLIAFFNHKENKIKLSFNKNSKILLIMILLLIGQIVWGAFTSGLNAGLLYQTWPLMNGKFIADDINMLNIFSSMSLTNPSYVQLIHRLLAYFIFVLFIFLYFFKFRKLKNKKFIYPVYFALFIQIALGILTLISGLNIYLASMHQMGSVLLITAVIYALFSLNNDRNAN